MKRAISLLLFLAIVLTVVPASCFAYPSVMYVDTANKKSLNLRSDMSTKATVLTQIPYRAEVQIVEMQQGQTWVTVSYNGITGYVMVRYLSMTRPDYAPIPTARPTAAPIGSIYDQFGPVYARAIVAPSSPGGFVNMRWAPSLQAPVFSICYANVELYVYYANDTWCQVYNPTTNTFGYMMRAFLRFTTVFGDGMVLAEPISK